MSSCLKTTVLDVYKRQGEDSFGCDNTIMVHLRHLREKIESNPAFPEYLITMKGLGYKLVNPYEK